MAERGLSGSTMIKLSLVVVLLIAGGIIVYIESKAARQYHGAFAKVEEESPKDEAAVHLLLGQQPEETKVIGNHYVEKYVFRRFFGNNYVYYAVYANEAEPRALTSHHKAELPYHIGAAKPNLKAPEDN